MSKKVKAAASWDMKEALYEDLRDPSYAAAYVNEALLEGDEVVFKTAIADVIRVYYLPFSTDSLRNRLCDPTDQASFAVRAQVSGSLGRDPRRAYTGQLSARQNSGSPKSKFSNRTKYPVFV